MKDGMGSIFVWYIQPTIPTYMSDNSAVMDVYVRRCAKIVTTG